MLEALEQIEDDEQVTFVIDSRNYNVILETVKVFNHEAYDENYSRLFYKLYIELAK